ncbi:MAG: serine/threonine-protein kinase [Rhizonema sp. NSF051]|nr:serine/threonine-protein kinase [Rhizonema sp. NSF051]
MNVCSESYQWPKSLLNNRYRILKPISHDGVGKTFLAVDEKSQENIDSICKPCIIKQLFPQRHHVHCHPIAEKLFRQESLLLSELSQHPQVPLLLDIFEQNAQQYIVQEWIDGQTLEEELAREGVFNEAEIRQILQEMLPVLQFFHDHQVIHRDIKPANIIRRQTDGKLILVDNGMSKYAPSSVFETTGNQVGSAEYAAPEQIRGKAVFTSDLYSLGLSCLHLLTQMSPFDLLDCSEDAWLWRSHLTTPISSSLSQILCKLLQKATKRRYQSATEVLGDLNPSSKQFVPSNLTARMKTDDQDYEIPYFGSSCIDNLQYASTISYAAQMNLPLINSITVFDPQTQEWYYLPGKKEVKEIEQTVTAFLIFWRLLRAIATTSLVWLTILCLASSIQPHPTATTVRINNLRLF